MILTDFIFLFIIRVVFFMIRVDLSPILFYFCFFIRSELVRVDPSWSDPDWRSELIRSDFCTCQWLRVQGLVDKTLRLVRISLSISAIQRVLRFFSGNLFYESNRKLFPCVCTAWYKHSRRWENSRQLCKPSTSSRVCITVSNFPNPSRVYIGLCKHGKRFLLLK